MNGQNKRIRLYLGEVKAVVFHSLAVMAFTVFSFVEMTLVWFLILSLLTIIAVIVNLILWIKNRKNAVNSQKVFDGHDFYFLFVFIFMFFIGYLPCHSEAVRGRKEERSRAEIDQKQDGLVEEIKAIANSKKANKPFERLSFDDIYLEEEEVSVSGHTKVSSLNGDAVVKGWKDFRAEDCSLGGKNFLCSGIPIQINQVAGDSFLPSFYKSYKNVKRINFGVKMANGFKPGEIKDFIVAKGSVNVEAAYPVPSPYHFTVNRKWMEVSEITFAIVEGVYRKRLLELRQIERDYRNRPRPDEGKAWLLILVFLVTVIHVFVYLFALVGRSESADLS